jgi:hypothetical protein
MNITKKIVLLFITLLLIYGTASAHQPEKNRNIDLFNEILLDIGTYDKEAYLMITRYLYNGVRPGVGLNAYQMGDDVMYAVNISITDKNNNKCVFNDFFKGSFKADYTDTLGGTSEKEIKTISREDFFKASKLPRIR